VGPALIRDLSLSCSLSRAHALSHAEQQQQRACARGQQTSWVSPRNSGRGIVLPDSGARSVPRCSVFYAIVVLQDRLAYPGADSLKAASRGLALGSFFFEQILGLSSAIC
jgi:hypothetical protein